MLELPLRWKLPQVIFVNSMSDLFHKDVPTEFVERVFVTMERADWHTYQVLTKRSPRMRDFVNARYRGGRAPAHIWLGTSLENRSQLSRLRHIQGMNASIRFLSIEPMLGPVGKLSLEGIHWVIVGGESGPGHRPIQPEWIREVRDQCVDANVAFFFKQWGGVQKKRAGRILEGRTWDEMPKNLVRV